MLVKYSYPRFVLIIPRLTMTDWLVVSKMTGWFSISYTQRIHGAGIFTYIWAIFGVNVGKYSIHGSYGIWDVILPIDEGSIIFQYCYCTTNQMNIAVSLLLYCKYPFGEFNIANWNMAHWKILDLSNMLMFLSCVRNSDKNPYCWPIHIH